MLGFLHRCWLMLKLLFSLAMFRWAQVARLTTRKANAFVFLALVVISTRWTCLANFRSSSVRRAIQMQTFSLDKRATCSVDRSTPMSLQCWFATTIRTYRFVVGLLLTLTVVFIQTYSCISRSWNGSTEHQTRWFCLFLRRSARQKSQTLSRLACLFVIHFSKLTMCVRI